MSIIYRYTSYVGNKLGIFSYVESKERVIVEVVKARHHMQVYLVIIYIILRSLVLRD